MYYCQECITTCLTLLLPTVCNYMSDNTLLPTMYNYMSDTLLLPTMYIYVPDNILLPTMYEGISIINLQIQDATYVLELMQEIFIAILQ